MMAMAGNLIFQVQSSKKASKGDSTAPCPAGRLFPHDPSFPRKKKELFY
jgi:hypothetical protein